MSFLAGLLGPSPAEVEASQYVQEYMESTLVGPYVRVALMEHPAAPFVFPIFGSLGTVLTMWISRRVPPFRPKPPTPIPRLASQPIYLLAATTFGSVGGGLAHSGQRIAAHEALVEFLEGEVVPHFTNLKRTNRAGARPYSQMIKMMEEKIAEERAWLAKKHREPPKRHAASNTTAATAPKQ